MCKPKYSLVHRGHFEMEQHMMGESAMGAQVDSCRPRELIVKIQLPRCNRAGDVDLDVSAERLVLQVEKVYAYWWIMGTCWLQCAIMLVAMYSIAIICNMIEESRFQSKCHVQRITYQGLAKVDVKSHRNNSQLDYDMLRASSHVTYIKSNRRSWAKYSCVND